MKVYVLLCFSAIAASTSAFAPAVPTPAAPASSTRLHVATKGKAGPVRKSIGGLTKDNFSSTLAEIEPFLLEEAGRTLYVKSLRRIAVRASALDVEVPGGYAKEAKCTAKRREKQDAYCKAKAEEVAAAEAPEEEAAEEEEVAAEE